MQQRLYTQSSKKCIKCSRFGRHSPQLQLDFLFSIFQLWLCLTASAFDFISFLFYPSCAIMRCEAVNCEERVIILLLIFFLSTFMEASNTSGRKSNTQTFNGLLTNYSSKTALLFNNIMARTHCCGPLGPDQRTPSSTSTQSEILALSAGSC